MIKITKEIGYYFSFLLIIIIYLLIIPFYILGLVIAILAGVISYFNNDDKSLKEEIKLGIEMMGGMF